MKLFLSAVLFSIVFASSAFAGNQTGTVTEIEVSQDGHISFQLSGTHNSRPTCASGYTNWILQDPHSEIGKQQLAALLTARSKGATVFIGGTNTCHPNYTLFEQVDRLVVY